MVVVTVFYPISPPCYSLVGATDPNFSSVPLLDRFPVHLHRSMPLADLNFM
jgi:hypothetical protein